MAKHTSFRVGKVRADLRSKVWYLTYFEDGQRRRPRVGASKDAARQMAALEPNTAAGDEDVTHPQVHDRTLCEGDGRAPNRNALRQGRLCDFFLLVQQVLQTYNAGSAYVRLTDWDGKSCADCGDTCGRNSSNYCDDCEITLCSDCGGMCSACEGNFCAVCRGACHGCDDRFCRNCPPTVRDAATAFVRSVSPMDTAKSVESPTTRPPMVEPRRRRRPPRRPTLRFTPWAWAKLVFLRDLGPTEVGGFGISAEDDLLLIEDICLVRQRCSSVTVQFDDSAVAEFFDEQVDRGLLPERFARVWIHTHPGNSASPSCVDEETFVRSFGRSDWAIMFLSVHSRNRHSLCRQTLRQ